MIRIVYLGSRDLPDEGVHVLEPASEFRVPVCIAVDFVEGIEEIIQGRAVCKSFNESLAIILAFTVSAILLVTHLQIGFHRSDSLVAAEFLCGSSTLLGDVSGVTTVLLGERKERANSLLV
jgi:hypothetical protein